MESLVGNGSPRSLVVRQLVLAFSALLLVALVLGMVSLYRIAQSLDERERSQSSFHTQSSLEQLQKNERAYLLSYAFWQAAYDHLAGPVDSHWAYDEDNVGQTLYSDNGYEGVFVLDDDGTHYAVIKGELSTRTFDDFSASGSRVVQLARAAVKQDQAASGFIMFAGQPALFSAAVIRSFDTAPFAGAECGAGIRACAGRGHARRTGQDGRFEWFRHHRERSPQTGQGTCRWKAAGRP